MPHCSTVYIDVDYCYLRSIVVCQSNRSVDPSVGLSH